LKQVLILAGDAAGDFRLILKQGQNHAEGDAVFGEVPQHAVVGDVKVQSGHHVSHRKYRSPGDKGEGGEDHAGGPSAEIAPIENARNGEELEEEEVDAVLRMAA